MQMGAGRCGGPQVTEVDLPGARREGGPQSRLDRPPTAGASGTSAATGASAATGTGAAIGDSAASGTSAATGTATGPGPRPAPCPDPGLVIPHSPSSNIFSSESSARLAIDFTDPRLIPRVAAIWASVSSPQ